LGDGGRAQTFCQPAGLPVLLVHRLYLVVASASLTELALRLLDLNRHVLHDCQCRMGRVPVLSAKGVTTAASGC
jgi:hypothetical protein